MSRNGQAGARTRIVFLVIERHEEDGSGPLLLYGPWDEIEEARAEVNNMDLESGDRYFIVKPLEVGTVTRARVNE